MKPIVDISLLGAALVLEPGSLDLDDGENENLLSDVLDRLREARRRDAVVLLNIDSMGGHALAGLALFHALRTHSEFGWTSVAYVRHAVSSAVAVALGADYLVVDPAGGFGVHGMGVLGGADSISSSELESVLETHARLCGAIVASRTFVPLEEARRWSSGLSTPEAVEGIEVIRADRALSLGFADLLGGCDTARALAARLAAGEVVSTPRREALASRARSAVAPDLARARHSGMRTSMLFGRSRSTTCNGGTHP